MTSKKLRKKLTKRRKVTFNVERRKDVKFFNYKLVLASCILAVLSCSTHAKGLRDIIIPDQKIDELISYVKGEETNPMYAGISLTTYNHLDSVSNISTVASVEDLELNLVGSGENSTYEHDYDIAPGQPEFVSVMSEFIEVDNDIIYPEDIEINPSDITVISGATEDMIEAALDNTWLDGYGWLYYELEHQYGINAFISIANAFQESGWDKSYNAKYNNNCYGIMTGSGTAKQFSSIESCIRYWFDLIHTNYVNCGRESLSSINSKYCPPDSTWGGDIADIANRLKNKVISTMS